MTKDNRISIKQYEQAADEKVSLEGIKWLRKWDVCVQCDSEEEAEALRARLAQPEPAECDGGQCGIGGYCKQCPKTQPEQEPVGINEVILDSIRDSSEVVAPPKREWVGLTNDEVEEAGNFNVEGERMLPYSFARVIEAKLKEKNT